MSATHAEAALMRALNGDAPHIDPPTRRGLTALAAEIDESRADMADGLAGVASAVERLRKVTYGAAATIVCSAVTVIITNTGK